MKLNLPALTELELSELSLPGFVLEGDAGGEGFGALQMFAASATLCAASVLVHYAEHVLHVGYEQLSLGTRWSYTEDNRRVDRIELVVHWANLPENRRDAVRRAVETCTIHHTLEHPPELLTRVESG
jgi:uncharacterized OsmC-like protein